MREMGLSLVCPENQDIEPCPKASGALMQSGFDMPKKYSLPFKTFCRKSPVSIRFPPNSQTGSLVRTMLFSRCKGCEIFFCQRRLESKSIRHVYPSQPIPRRERERPGADCYRTFNLHSVCRWYPWYHRHELPS